MEAAQIEKVILVVIGWPARREEIIYAGTVPPEVGPAGEILNLGISIDR